MSAAAGHEPAAGYVNGRAVPAKLVEERLRRLREADRACVLPASGSREGRQLRRWVAHVLLVETICVDELAERGIDWGVGPASLADEAPGLGSRRDGAALGSIVAAAWSGHPAVRRAAEVVTRDVELSSAAKESAERLGRGGPSGELVWDLEELRADARMATFARWVSRAMHERVALVPGFEHPGDTSQPDNLHRH